MARAMPSSRRQISCDPVAAFSPYELPTRSPVTTARARSERRGRIAASALRRLAVRRSGSCSRFRKPIARVNDTRLRTGDPLPWRLDASIRHLRTSAHNAERTAAGRAPTSHLANWSKTEKACAFVFNARVELSERVAFRCQRERERLRGLCPTGIEIALASGASSE